MAHPKRAVQWAPISPPPERTEMGRKMRRSQSRRDSSTGNKSDDHFLKDPIFWAGCALFEAALSPFLGVLKKRHLLTAGWIVALLALGFLVMLASSHFLRGSYRNPVNNNASSWYTPAGPPRGFTRVEYDHWRRRFAIFVLLAVASIALVALLVAFLYGGGNQPLNPIVP